MEGKLVLLSLAVIRQTDRPTFMWDRTERTKNIIAFATKKDLFLLFQRPQVFYSYTPIWHTRESLLLSGPSFYLTTFLDSLENDYFSRRAFNDVSLDLAWPWEHGKHIPLTSIHLTQVSIKPNCLQLNLRQSHLYSLYGSFQIPNPPNIVPRLSGLPVRPDMYATPFSMQQK